MLFKCTQCSTEHRNKAQFLKHKETPAHKKQAPAYLWSLRRIEKNQGVFFQVQILDVLWEPVHILKKEHKELRLDVRISSTHTISLVLGERSADVSRTFSYFDPEISVYTIQVAFQS
ncbi:hypothetical protein NECID01_1263 [Nematocida sp. AWRm77]|nr:hypothetical protein NECID01_1263 [Nematocida sp. AWRm77]